MLVHRLVAGVAHELNTPLGAILLSVESAISLVQLSPDKAGKRLERAATSVQTAHRIVSGLLAYSRRTLERKIELDVRDQVQAAFSIEQMAGSIEAVYRVLRRPAG